MKTFGWMASFLLAMMMSVGAQAATEPRPVVGPQVKAYSGQEGIKVWLVRVGPRAANQAIVQIGGIDHDWNMKIQKMDLQSVRDESRYSLKVEGQPYVALILRGSSGEVFLPGEHKSYGVYFDEQLSSSGNAEHFLTDYLQQGK